MLHFTALPSIDCYFSVMRTMPPFYLPRRFLCDCLRGRIFTKFPSQPTTAEPRYNEGSRDWQNLFAINRFRYIKVLFHIFDYNYWGLKKSLVIPRLRYIEVPYIGVPL